MKGADPEPRLGNAVLLLTRLPTSEDELSLFISGSKPGQELSILA